MRCAYCALRATGCFARGEGWGRNVYVRSIEPHRPVQVVPGHLGSALGDAGELVERLLCGRHVGVAHEPPDLRIIRNDVRLDAAGRDGAMGPVAWAQVFAPLVEADVHQLDGIYGVLAVPWVHGAVGGLA